MRDALNERLEEVRDQRETALSSDADDFRPVAR